MKRVLVIASAMVAVILAVDYCEHHNDYKVASKDLHILSGNFIGDMRCLHNNDTVFVYGKYSSFLYSADTTWQTTHCGLVPVGFTTDSVMVKKIN